MRQKKKPKQASEASSDFSKKVGAALIRAAKRARETARMHGTKVYTMRDGKIVAEKP